ncbi:uncharacterized protein VTP21DRAFT_3653 [Calcarisporiella thermophila]|uniref:uncharacterized protein n=1 Tax=Calcarisporiella thermophila TaxID=911321 RepID=UPI0037426F0E
MSKVNLTIKCSNDTKYQIEIETSKTVLELKQAIAEKSDTAVERQRLIYSGRVLKDADTLESYKIQDGHTIHMVRSGASSGQSSQQQVQSQQTQPAAANTSSPGDGQAQQQPQSQQQQQQQQQQQPPNPFMNPFAALGGGSPFGFNPASTGAGAGYGMPPMDPGMFQQMMQSPFFTQQMSMLLQNPQVVDAIIASNPQFAAMGPELRQMMQSPEFRQMLSDPNTIRSMAAMSAAMGGMGGMSGMGGMGMGMPGWGGAQTTGSNPTGTPPANPFLSLLNPAAGTTPGTTAGAGTTPAANNPNPSPNASAPNPNPQQQPTTSPPGAGAYPNPFDPFWLMNALNQQQQTQQNTQPPEERYQVQLQQLNEMGFYNAEQNIRALQRCGGNVNAAIELLLSGNI